MVNLALPKGGHARACVGKGLGRLWPEFMSASEDDPENESQANGDAAPEAPGAGGLEFIVWDEDRMGTGVASIDEQHKELFRHLNELYRAHRAGLNRRDLDKILRFFSHYAETHFHHEEEVMEERQCPLRHENRLAHAKFLRDYQQLVEDFSTDEDADQIATEIEKMAGQWLSTHICRVDAALRDCPAIVPKAGDPGTS